MVRAVGDRALFCFSALLWDNRMVLLPSICSCQQKHLSPWGVTILISYGQKHRRGCDYIHKFTLTLGVQHEYVQYVLLVKESESLRHIL